MATARKCDRCGGYYDQYDVREGLDVIEHKPLHDVLSDLCPCCKKDLEDFMNMGKVESKDD